MTLSPKQLKLPDEIADRVRLDHTERDLADMVARYKAGETAYVIAAAYNTTPSTIAARLRALGVEMKPRGRRKLLTDAQVAEAKRYRAAGKSWPFLGKKYGVAANTVRRAATQSGETV